MNLLKKTLVSLLVFICISPAWACDTNFLSDSQMEDLIARHVKTFNVQLENETSISKFVNVTNWIEFQNNPFGLISLMGNLSAFDSFSSDALKILNSLKNNKALVFSAQRFKWHYGFNKIIKEYNFAEVCFRFTTSEVSPDQLVIDLEEALEALGIKTLGRKLGTESFPSQSIMAARVYTNSQVMAIENVLSSFQVRPTITSVSPRLSQVKLNLWTPVALEKLDSEGAVDLLVSYHSRRQAAVLKLVAETQKLKVKGESYVKASRKGDRDQYQVRIRIKNQESLLEFNNMMKYMIYEPVRVLAY